MNHDPNCIFCKIVAGDLPATVVNRADGFIAIEDINPIADVHVVVPGAVVEVVGHAVVRPREQGVDDHHLDAVGDEQVDDVGTDEPGPTGHEHTHGRVHQ